MTNEKITDIVQFIFLQHFNIQPENFDWEQPLEKLDTDFKILGNLVFLEQLLQKEFEKNVHLLENISTAFHTPKDVLQLVINEF